MTNPQTVLRRLFDVAVQRALPLHNTAAHLPAPPKGRTLVLGAGKAAGKGKSAGSMNRNQRKHWKIKNRFKELEGVAGILPNL